MKRRWKGILWVIFLLYIGVLLRITVFRSSFGSYPLCSHGQIELVPFVGLIQIFHNSVGMFLYLFVGNLVWFVPLGVLLPVLTKARQATILWGLGLSPYIEVSVCVRDWGQRGGGFDPQYRRNGDWVFDLFGGKEIGAAV